MKVEIEPTDRIRIYERTSSFTIDNELNKELRVLDIELEKVPLEVFEQIKEVFNRIVQTPVDQLEVKLTSEKLKEMGHRPNTVEYELQVGVRTTPSTFDLENRQTHLTTYFRLYSLDEPQVIKEIYDLILPYAGLEDLQYKNG